APLRHRQARAERGAGTPVLFGGRQDPDRVTEDGRARRGNSPGTTWRHRGVHLRVSSADARVLLRSGLRSRPRHVAAPGLVGWRNTVVRRPGPRDQGSVLLSPLLARDAYGRISDPGTVRLGPRRRVIRRGVAILRRGRTSSRARATGARRTVRAIAEPRASGGG